MRWPRTGSAPCAAPASSDRASPSTEAGLPPAGRPVSRRRSAMQLFLCSGQSHVLDILNVRNPVTAPGPAFRLHDRRASRCAGGRCVRAPPGSDHRRPDPRADDSHAHLPGMAGRPTPVPGAPRLPVSPRRVAGRRHPPPLPPLQFPLAHHARARRRCARTPRIRPQSRNRPGPVRAPAWPRHGDARQAPARSCPAADPSVACPPPPRFFKTAPGLAANP